MAGVTASASRKRKAVCAAEGGVTKRRLRLGASATSAKHLVARAKRCLDAFPPREDRALALLRQALVLEPDHGGALDLLAGVLCDAGKVDEAKPLLLRSVQLAPDSNAEKYFYLAQMASGAEALERYDRGAGILEAQLAQLGPGDTPEGGTGASVRRQLARVHAAIAELHMTDPLCDAPEAEQHCEAALARGFEVDAQSFEIREKKATLRKVQGRLDEARELGRECLQQLKAASPAGDAAGAAAIPLLREGTASEAVSEEARVGLAQTLIDVDLAEEAREVLLGLLDEDEENPQVWYLLGCSHLVEEDVACTLECVENGLRVCKLAAEGGDASAAEWAQSLHSLADRGREMAAELRDKGPEEAVDDAAES